MARQTVERGTKVLRALGREDESRAAERLAEELDL